ncbi:MAG: ABC transporter permease [Anaerolineae bacterium]
MTKYLVRRLISTVPVLLIVTLMVFSVLHLAPGDPAVIMLGEEYSEELAAQVRAKLGLDQPIYIQYLRWAGSALRGDLGSSLRTRQPVLEAIGQRLPVSIQLGALAILIALTIAVPIGILSALKRNSLLDIVGTGFALVGVAMPNFWLGILLIFLFALILRWLPATGYVNPLEDPVGGIRSLLMPALTLGAAMSAVIMRQLRANLLAVLGEQYIITARAKGLHEQTVIRSHALKNALIPVVTILGLQVRTIIGGTIIIEMIFALPGIGRLVASSVFTRDYPMVQGVILVMALAVIISNLIVDLAYAYLDPRIRYE